MTALEALHHGLRAVARNNDLSTLPIRQMAVLVTVARFSRLTVRGLASDLNISRPVVTRALDTLESMGLVSRRRDPDDRRSVLVDATPAGKRKLSELEAALA